MNDVSYSCIAGLLAGSLVTAVDSGTENRRRIEGGKDASR